jgi:hypothetical protein
LPFYESWYAAFHVYGFVPQFASVALLDFVDQGAEVDPGKVSHHSWDEEPGPFMAALVSAEFWRKTVSSIVVCMFLGA